MCDTAAAHLTHEETVAISAMTGASMVGLDGRLETFKASLCPRHREGWAMALMRGGLALARVQE